jgi:3-oxoacyl-[acyl-carrier protein] reductase
MSPPVRHVLITGGSRGIGLSIARLFAQNTYRCTLISRSEAALRSALDSLPAPADSSSAHTCIPGDVSSASFWQDNFGQRRGDEPVDVLVNCAGISQNRLLVREDPASIQSIVDTNLTGMMIGTRQLIKAGYLKKRKGEEEEEDFSPCIINVASLLGLKGGRGAVAYAASKAGALGFTRALVEETAKSGIRVNAIVPGYVSTDMTTGMLLTLPLRLRFSRSVVVRLSYAIVLLIYIQSWSHLRTS